VAWQTPAHAHTYIYTQCNCMHKMASVSHHTHTHTKCLQNKLISGTMRSVMSFFYPLCGLANTCTHTYIYTQCICMHKMASVSQHTHTHTHTHTCLQNKLISGTMRSVMSFFYPLCGLANTCTRTYIHIYTV